MDVPHLRPVDLTIIIFASNTQDLAGLQSTDEVRLTVLLHEGRVMFVVHGSEENTLGS